jgi:hypothetical protein
MAVQNIRTFAQKEKYTEPYVATLSRISERQASKHAIVCQSVCVFNLASWLLGSLLLCQEAAVYRESDCPASSGPVKVTEGSPPVMTRRVTLVVLRFKEGILRLILWLFSHALSSALVTGM